MDSVDISFAEEQAHIQRSLENARAQNSSSGYQRFKPVGYCLACYEDVSPDQLYCNVRCSKTHEQIQRLTRL